MINSHLSGLYPSELGGILCGALAGELWAEDVDTLGVLDPND
jgi:hypothetical protein